MCDRENQIYDILALYDSVIFKAILKLKNRGAKANSLYMHLSERFPHVTCLPILIFQLSNFEGQEYYYTS